MRLPLQVIPEAKPAATTADGGDLGRGSGTAYDVAQVSPIFSSASDRNHQACGIRDQWPRAAVENAASAKSPTA